MSTARATCSPVLGGGDTNITVSCVDTETLPQGNGTQSQIVFNVQAGALLTVAAVDNQTAVRLRDDNVITVDGSVVSGNSNAGLAIGIRLDGDDNVVTNNGRIAVGTGDGINRSYGILVLGSDNGITSSGSIIAGANGTGVRLNGNTNTFTNAATGLVSADANGHGVSIDAGANHVVNNAGRIIVGAGGTGVFFQGDGASGDGTLNNTGEIRAGAGGFSIFACQCTTSVINNEISGTLSGQITIEGNTTFENRGLITFTDSTATTAIGVTYNMAPVGGNITSFRQFTSGILTLRMAPPGLGNNIDQLMATNVTLAGTLRILVQPGLYGATTASTDAITRSTLGQITTTFDRFESSSPFFTVTPIYNGLGAQPNDYNILSVQLNRIPFGSVPGLTPNQRAVGNALEGSYSTTLTGNAATLYGNVLAATSVAVLDNISGEGTSATQNAAFGAGSLFNNAMQGQGLFGPNGAIGGVLPLAYAERDKPRGHDAFATLKAPARPQADAPSRWRVWVAGFGASRGFDGESATGSSSQSVRNYGGALGVERNVSHDLTFGIAVGGSGSTFSVGNLSTTGSTAGGHIGAYAIKAWGAAYAAASLSYAHFENDTRRTIVGAGGTETATGRFSGNQVGARIELGRRHALGQAAVTPFVAVEPAVLWQQGYTETASGVLGLAVASRTATSLPAFVGVQADSRHTLSGGMTIAPYARASWVHEFLPERRVTATFVSIPTATFTVDGARAARNAARIDAGAKLALRPGHTVFANFSGEWSNRTDSYSASGGYRASW